MRRLCKSPSRLRQKDELTVYRQLDSEALVAAIRALEALAHERTVAKLKQESVDVGPEQTDEESFTLPYDPVSIFLLETMVSIACQTPQYIDETWYVLVLILEEMAAEALQAGHLRASFIALDDADSIQYFAD